MNKKEALQIRNDRIGYKLTDSNSRSYNNTQWGPGITHEVTGGRNLCGPGWLHYYSDPLLAVILNPIFGNFRPKTMQLWECEIGGTIKSDHGLKYGTRRLTTLKQIPIPYVSDKQRVRFAILCAMRIYSEPTWVAWARGWLDGTNRSMARARAAANAALLDDVSGVAEKAAWAATDVSRAAARAPNSARSAAWAVVGAAKTAKRGKILLASVIS